MAPYSCDRPDKKICAGLCKYAASQGKISLDPHHRSTIILRIHCSFHESLKRLELLGTSHRTRIQSSCFEFDLALRGIHRIPSKPELISAIFLSTPISPP